MEGKINPLQIIEYEKEIAFYLANVLPTKKKTIPPSLRLEIEAAVDFIEKRARFYSNFLTNELLSLQEEHVSYFVELDQRLKKRERIIEKIIEKMNVDNMNMKDASISIKDSLRYTIVIDDCVYVEKIDEYLRKIENMGYEVVKLKNMWGNEYYQGVNVIFEDEHGFKFEIQFHTPNGYAIKEGKLRDVYNVIRDDKSPEELKQKCNAIRKYYQAQVRIPEGAVNYQYKSNAKKRG